MTTKPQSTTEETARLLPCPLFGHLPDKGEFTSGPYISVSGAPDMPKFYAVVCPGCCSTAYDEDKERVIRKWNTRVPASTALVVDKAQYDEAIDDRQKLGHQLACAATAFENAVTKLKAVVEDARIRVGASANRYNEPKEAQSGADYVASRVLNALDSMKSPIAAATAAPPPPVEQSNLASAHSYLTEAEQERVNQIREQRYAATLPANQRWTFHSASWVDIDFLLDLLGKAMRETAKLRTVLDQEFIGVLTARETVGRFQQLLNWQSPDPENTVTLGRGIDEGAR